MVMWSDLCLIWSVPAGIRRHVAACGWLPDEKAQTHHGKVWSLPLNLCRVHCFGHSANKVFAECPTKNTRQNKYTRQTVLCRVYYFWHSAKINICRVYFFILGKDFFAECIIFGTRQRLWFAECFVYTSKELNFFTFNLKKFSTLQIQHVLLHVKFWYIFIFVCYI